MTSDLSRSLKSWKKNVYQRKSRKMTEVRSVSCMSEGKMNFMWSVLFILLMRRNLRQRNDCHWCFCCDKKPASIKQILFKVTGQKNKGTVNQTSFYQQQLKLVSSPTQQVKRRQMMAPNQPMGQQTAAPKANQAPAERYKISPENWCNKRQKCNKSGDKMKRINSVCAWNK